MAPGRGPKRKGGGKSTRGDVLTPFLEPRGVVIIGISRAALDSPVSILTTLKDFGYRGEIYVVNPRLRAENADNIRFRPTLGEVPAGLDLAVVSVERGQVPGVLRDCVAKEIFSAIVITQGFADADAEGARLQQEIAELLNTSRLRIIGPNTVGVASSRSHFTSSFIEVREDHVAIGQVAQSGLFMMGHHLVNNEPAGYCRAIDLGNACDVSVVDVLEHYAKDPGVRVIQCHVEGLADGPAFLAAATRIGKSKPIVLLKAGRTQAGRAAVASHSGALAGDYPVFSAAMRQAGVVQAADAEELRLLSKAFVTYSPPRGRRVAVVSFSGGGAVLAIDALEAGGLTLAALAPATIAAMRDMFPAWMEVGNPVDMWIPVARDFHNAFPRILDNVMADPGVDAVICIYCSYSLPKYSGFDASGHIRSLAAKYREKPLLCWSYGVDIEGFTRRIEKDGNAMVFLGLSEATSTLGRLADYGDWARAAETADAPLELDAAGARICAQLAACAQAGRKHLFAEALEIFEACGLPVLRSRFARTRDELLTAARELNFPVCLKVVSDDIIHKSDAGGIVLGIENRESLAAAHDNMLAAVAGRAPDAAIQGVVVQEMAPRRGKEIIVGAKRDATFGPCVMVGAGGTYTELLDDSAIRLAPLGRAGARAMLDELRYARILKGARGEAPCALDSIAGIIASVSALMMLSPLIREIDINPVIVDEHGAVVVDARIIL